MVPGEPRTLGTGALGERMGLGVARLSLAAPPPPPALPESHPPSGARSGLGVGGLTWAHKRDIWRLGLRFAGAVLGSI